MTPTPHDDSPYRRYRPRRLDAGAPARTAHGRHRVASHAAARGRIFAPRPVALWPFADAEPLPGTALLAGWLGRMIVTLVTGYTSPGDRVLLLAPPAPPRGRPPTPHGARGTDPYAGLAEAVWTVARLGRGADTATVAPAPDRVGDHVDSLGRGEVESASGPRLGRLRLQTPTGPHRESEHRPARVNTGSGDRFDLIITAVHPHDTDWLADTDWDTVLAPTATLAVVTHSDHRQGRLVDPSTAIVTTLRSFQRGWLDHIAVLDQPFPAPASATGPTSPRASRGSAVGPPSVHSVHQDLLLFGPLLLPAAAGPVTDERGESSDD
ncbi:hypothetical protein [Amycolatopsis sp. NPDC059657]|uniref:hypothetical protein n=1 Tax=Amycolatopsis sp. NPDC059657 TaxID=3346899 RepID=UPI00367164B5